MSGFATSPTPPPEFPEELNLFLTRVVAYWAGELTPDERQRFEAQLPGLSAAEREVYDEVRTLFDALADEANGAVAPRRDLWEQVRARVQADLAWLTAVRRASGESAAAAVQASLPDSDDVACEPWPALQTGVETVFAAVDQAEPLVPSRDLLAPLRATLQQQQQDPASATTNVLPQPPAKGRLVLVRNWLGAGVTATVAAAAALMLAVGLGLLEPPGTSTTDPTNQPGTTGDNDGDGANGQPPEEEETTTTTTPDGDAEEEDAERREGQTVDATDDDQRPRESGEQWPQSFAPAFISFELDPYQPLPGEPQFEPLPQEPQEIRFFATKLEHWPPSLDMPEPPARIVLGKGIEGSRLSLPTTDGNLHLRRSRERGVLEIYQDNEPNRRTIIRSEGTIDVMLRRYRDGGRREVVPYSVRFTYETRLDTWYASSASMMVSHTEIAGRRLVLVDADVNGRFNDIGTDYIFFAESPSATHLSELVALGDETFHLSLDPSGLKAEIAPYRGPSAGLVVEGAYRDGVGLEYVYLRSAQTSLLVEPHMLGRPVTVPPGRYELSHGRVGDGSRSVWIDAFEMRDRGELVDAGGFEDAQPPALAPTALVSESPRGHTEQEPVRFVLGGELVLRPYCVHSEHTQLKQLPLQLALLGQHGERYRPITAREPQPLLPGIGEVRARDTGKRLGEAEIEPTVSTLLPFIADLRARAAEPSAAHELRLVENEVSELLRGAPSEAVVPLR